jgi:hypothetical protein
MSVHQTAFSPFLTNWATVKTLNNGFSPLVEVISNHQTPMTGFYRHPPPSKALNSQSLNITPLIRQQTMGKHHMMMMICSQKEFKDRKKPQYYILFYFIQFI